MDVEGRHKGDIRPSVIPRRVAELATRRHGVVAHAELIALGVDVDRIKRWLGAGRLHHLHEGVYAVGHRSLGPKGRYLAAVLACGEGAALSHASAADLHGLRASASPKIDVIVTRRSRRAHRGIRIHRPRILAPVDVTEVDGIPCTTVARTLVDLAGVARPWSLERAVEAAERQGLLDVAAIAEVLDRISRPRGVRALRAILAGRVVAPLTREELERRFYALCAAAGLPRPIANAPVELAPGDWITVDFLWPALHLIVETDGWATHSTLSAARRDRRRDRGLRHLGFRVERFMWDDVVFEPATVLRDLRRCIRASRDD